AAVDRLARALEGGEKIGIFGDYDVDGTSGTAILAKLFRHLGQEVAYRVPHRKTDGYGLNAKAVEDFAAAGVTLLVTVDCGTNDVEEVALARARGMDVVVLDHHEPAAGVAPATAILNPKLKGSGYGFTGICSAGVAFKLAWALGERMGAKRRPGFDGYILDAMGLAALGTVADVCPLVGENRVFVRYGLDALRACKGKGLRALLELARVGEKPIDTFDVAFKLAPRLNALGRVGSAMDCVDLLVSEDDTRIGEILQILEKSNRHRKNIEDEMVQQAVAQAEAMGADAPILVVADERWHIGVVGIVAAKLVDRYHRPAVVLAIDNGLARGSARSIEGLALHEALAACSEHLETHGGHAMAAGLSIRTEKIDAFRRALERYAGKRLTADHYVPRLDLDDEVPLASITKAVAREMERLAPHGPGNPVPTLATSGASLAAEPRLMGKKSDHLSFYVRQQGAGPALRAVGFGMGALFDPLSKARTVSIAYTPQVNAWNGSETVELHVKDVKFDA
ncbi:MAG TPA: single-stranded-DNA-specific exonuclease RecJ, partial [Planctomycetota bacterium]|nr:single-stranded-DNA-specific exonuclease RecJ [Planctomycetota bacterium]